MTPLIAAKNFPESLREPAASRTLAFTKEAIMAITLATNSAFKRKRQDHTKLKAIAKANPGLRWQFWAERYDGKSFWQTLPPNKVPQWAPYKLFRVKPGQNVMDPQTRVATKAVDKPEQDAMDPKPETEPIYHKYAHAILSDVLTAMDAATRPGATVNLSDLTLREADKIVRAIAAAINVVR
jgi:hypothetical protein